MNMTTPPGHAQALESLVQEASPLVQPPHVLNVIHDVRVLDQAHEHILARVVPWLCVWLLAKANSNGGSQLVHEDVAVVAHQAVLL